MKKEAFVSGPQALTEIAAGREALTERGREISQLHRELTSREQEVERLQSEVSVTKMELEQARVEASRLLANLRQSQADAVESNEVFRLEIELGRALQVTQKECSSLRQQLAEVRHAYSSVTTSTIWRMTAPLRNVLTALKSLRLLARRVIRRSWTTPSVAYTAVKPANWSLLRSKFERSGLFDPAVYLELHEDIKGTDPWQHFLECGLDEGRRFTTSEFVARAIAKADSKIRSAADTIRQQAQIAAAEEVCTKATQSFLDHKVKFGIFSNSRGNFFMQEIANLLAWQLQAFGIDAHLRTEEGQMQEAFDVRIFVAPHEFFFLGNGPSWRHLAAADGSVLYNVEQMQTQWFCLAFPLLLNAPLILDINFQSAELLRQVGCNAVHFMPPYLARCPYTRSQVDVSHIEVMRGYEFSHATFDWTEYDDIMSRPIDILFIASSSPRRDGAIERLRELSDKHRFVCVYTHQRSPLVAGNNLTTSTEINCALAQRSKIILNVHRDWLGYFEWSRMMLQGFWQGSCVASDPCLPHPLFQAGEHFLEESTRHMPELLRWLLETPEGHTKMNDISVAAHNQARSSGVRAAMLLPMLSSLKALLKI